MRGSRFSASPSPNRKFKFSVHEPPISILFRPKHACTRTFYFKHNFQIWVLNCKILAFSPKCRKFQLNIECSSRIFLIDTICIDHVIMYFNPHNCVLNIFYNEIPDRHSCLNFRPSHLFLYFNVIIIAAHIWTEYLRTITIRRLMYPAEV